MKQRRAENRARPGVQPPRKAVPAAVPGMQAHVIHYLPPGSYEEGESDTFRQVVFV